MNVSYANQNQRVDDSDVTSGPGTITWFLPPDHNNNLDVTRFLH
jgi:hypothetical protein